MTHTLPIKEEGQILLNEQHSKLTFFDRGSSQLVITFNSMGLGLDDDFGRSFFQDIHISQINVACASKDFFQSLSLEDFSSAISPIVKRYRDIISYGTSLGAYAALYFASALPHARTLAVAPRLPIHSYMEGMRSYHPNMDIRHKDLRSVADPQNSRLIVYDPQEEADAKFVSHFISDCENTRLIALEGAGHYILKQLHHINMLAPCIESFVKTGNFRENEIDQNAFTQPRRHKAQAALERGDLATARTEIEYLINIRTGHDPFMTPWGLIKHYVDVCEAIDITLPQILPTEYATLSHRMGRPSTPQKMMEALIKHNYLTCQYQACLSLAQLTQTRHPQSQTAKAYIEKATQTLAKV